jgi:hypothetical protein
MTNNLTSIRLMKVFDLKIKCKQLGIKGYSRFRKRELQDFIIDYLKKKQENEIKTQKGLFCYPDIISKIYEFVDYDDTNQKRKEVIINSKKEILRLQKLKKGINDLNMTPRATRLFYRNDSEFHSSYYLNAEIYKNIVLNKNLEELNNKKLTLKNDLKTWIKTLKLPIKGLSKLRKNQLLDIVNEKYSEIMD